MSTPNQDPEKWDSARVSAAIADCRRQIGQLRMRMPGDVAVALQTADYVLADCEVWIAINGNTQSSSGRNQ